MSRAASSHRQVLATFAGIGQAVGHPARLRILSLLAQAPKTVTTLAEAIGESIANASAHLGVLSDAGLVRRWREGRHIRYSLADDSIGGLVTSLRSVAEAVAPARARRHLHLFDGPDVAALTPRTLPERLASGVELLDVRPEDEFAAGHLPGARSAPLSHLRARGASVAGAGPLLLYCRGRYCLGAVEGVQLLARAGRDVRRLPFGVTEWKAEGHILEVS
jgi:DNA-binding transcriptional ArsR family regulator